MPLKDQLGEAKASFIARVPEEAQETVFRHIREQQQSGSVFGLKEGERVPDFTLANPLGSPITLYEELAKGPVVLVFYRGAWCPYCNIQLRAYQQVLPDIQAYGARLIAVSPQSPDNALSQQEKEGLAFPVLSDPDGLVAASFGLLFELPDYLRATFINMFKLDLAAFNASERWVLPVPAMFLIDKEGVVRRVYVNPDFMDRMEPRDMIEELKKLE